MTQPWGTPVGRHYDKDVLLGKTHPWNTHIKDCASAAAVRTRVTDNRAVSVEWRFLKPQWFGWKRVFLRGSHRTPLLNSLLMIKKEPKEDWDLMIGKISFGRADAGGKLLSDPLWNHIRELDQKTVCVQYFIPACSFRICKHHLTPSDTISWSVGQFFSQSLHFIAYQSSYTRTNISTITGCCLSDGGLMVNVDTCYFRGYQFSFYAKISWIVVGCSFICSDLQCIWLHGDFRSPL